MLDPGSEAQWLLGFADAQFENHKGGSLFGSTVSVARDVSRANTIRRDIKRR